jgi:hypothetical protein
VNISPSVANSSAPSVANSSGAAIRISAAKKPTETTWSRISPMASPSP